MNALDKAVRKALERFYPEIGHIRLIDYKVRVIDASAATEATVRVLIRSTDGAMTWTTVGRLHQHHRGQFDGPDRFHRVQADEVDGDWMRR